MVTNDAYQNFELEIDWEISQGGNRGITLEAHDDPRYNGTCPACREIQVPDNIEASGPQKGS